MNRPSRSAIVALAVALLYGAVALWRAVHHVFWADEWSVWLASKMHASVADVIDAVRYDGHPPAWYILLHGLSRVCGDPVIAKIAHVAIAGGSVYVIWRHGPFSLAEKILLPLGYFFFFEYSTITRSYAAGVFLALVAVAMFRHAGRRPIVFALLLLALGQWSVFGMVLSLALAAGVGSRWIKEGPPDGWKTAVAILAASLALFYLTTRAPVDGTGRAFWMNDWRHLDPVKAAATVFDAYLPLPKITKHWWNTQMLPLPDTARAILAVAMVGAAAISCRTREARTVLLVGTAAVVGIAFFIYTGSMRHWGHSFIVLVLAVWIDRTLRSDGPSKVGAFAFTLLLLIQAAGGLIAAGLDWRQPFSAAPRAAEVINELGPRLPIAGDFDYELVSVAGELNRPIWFFRTNDYGWSVRYDLHRKRNVTLKMISDQVQALAEREKSDVVLVMTYAVALPPYFEPVARIESETIPEETYLIYRYRWKQP